VDVLAVAILLLMLVCFAGACWCRSHWADLARPVRSILRALASGFTGLYAFMLCTQWVCTSALANEIVGALAVGGYSLLVLLLTVFPSKIARLLPVLLLLPVPAAMVWLPLSARSSGPIATQHVAGELYVDKWRWDAGAFGSSGTILLLYEKPRLVPFVEHRLQRVVFDESKCQSDRAFVVMQADRRHALARCPWPEYLQRPGFHDFLVPLY
jgi:hypothetical protein